MLDSINPKDKKNSNEQENFLNEFLIPKKKYTVGIHAVIELISEGGFFPDDKIFTARKNDDQRLMNFFRKAKKNQVSIEKKTFAELDKFFKDKILSSNKNAANEKQVRHQGIILERQKSFFLQRISEQEILESCLQKKFQLYIVADGIVDPGNLGAICRSMLAFNAKALIVSDKNTAPLGISALKSSVGALAHVPVCRSSSLVNLLKKAQEQGGYVVATAMQGTHLSTNWLEGIIDFKKSIFLIMGSEEKGVRPAMEEICNEILTIPQSPLIQSLNVSVSTAILLQRFYEAERTKKD